MSKIENDNRNVCMGNARKKYTVRLQQIYSDLLNIKQKNSNLYIEITHSLTTSLWNMGTLSRYYRCLQDVIRFQSLSQIPELFKFLYLEIL